MFRGLFKMTEAIIQPDQRALVPERGYFTLKEAKAIRCAHPDCERFHATCRRCGLHVAPRRWLDFQGYLNRGQLCNQCKVEFDQWHLERLKKVLAEWDALPESEREGLRQEGCSPMWLPHAYTQWMKENPLIETVCSSSVQFRS